MLLHEFVFLADASNLLADLLLHFSGTNDFVVQFFGVPCETIYAPGIVVVFRHRTI